MRNYAEVLGEHLRRIRHQQDLSLQDIEEATDGELKASVLGAYERGERSVSVPRLRRLAEFYRVPVAELLPPETEDAQPERARVGTLRLDLTSLPLDTPEGKVVRRYVSSVQVRRSDFGSRVMTLRGSDLDVLAVFLNIGPTKLRERLQETGALTEAGP